MRLEKQQIVNQLFRKSVIFRVPLYQRHYVWDDTNWEHLWNDITKMLDLRDENKVKEHFTGAIVIQGDDQNPPCEIIDGQQRLTTFQLILCAIRDVHAANFIIDPNEIKSGCERSMTAEPLGSLHPMNDEECKLLPREGQDQDIFQSLVKEEQNQLDKKSKIWKAYDYFKRKIVTYVKDDYNRLHRFYESITQDFIVVVISVDQEDEYAKVFKSINGTGRRLDQFDLLRNDLFLRTKREKREDWYNKYWWHFEDPNSDWRTDGVVDNFLENFLKVKLGKDFDCQFNLFDLYELYCTQLKRELNLSETDTHLVRYEFHEIRRCSKVYEKLQTSNSEGFGNRLRFYEEFTPTLKIVDQLRLYILHLVTEFGLSSSELSKIFNIFESYVLREMLYISSRRHNLDRLDRLENSVLDALKINKKNSFNSVKLILQLSKTWKTDKEIEHVLTKGIPQNEENRRKKRKSSIIMSQFGGKYIFQVLGWDIDPGEKLFKEFCKKWPSPRNMLPKELIGGVPIVYSQLPISKETIQMEEDIQAKSRSAPYMFVTSQETLELSACKKYPDSIIGNDVNGTEQILDIREILFAFPSSAKEKLPSGIDSVKVLNLESTTKRYEIKDWIIEERPALKTLVEESNSGFHILEIGVVTVVTRAGHELRGRLKCFSDVALYLEIQAEIVTVYTHGIHKLDM